LRRTTEQRPNNLIRPPTAATAAQNSLGATVVFPSMKRVPACCTRAMLRLYKVPNFLFLAHACAQYFEEL